jgi:hypothetical protein
VIQTGFIATDDTNGKIEAKQTSLFLPRRFCGLITPRESYHHPLGVKVVATASAWTCQKPRRGWKSGCALELTARNAKSTEDICVLCG